MAVLGREPVSHGTGSPLVADEAPPLQLLGSVTEATDNPAFAARPGCPNPV
jgi:hypothetical protein